jgi:anti-sigma B factor antagonist
MHSPDILRVTVQQLDDARLIRAVGELDMSSTPTLRHELEAARHQSVTALLDMSDVTFIDSTGLHLLLEASRSTGRADWSFFIVRPSTAVERLIEISGTRDRLALVEPAAERSLA